MSQRVDTILVPQGAEYAAVCRGRARSIDHSTRIVAIPVGMAAVERFLAAWEPKLAGRVLVMGLCGSLSPQYGVGAAVLYQACVAATEQACDRSLTAEIQAQLKLPIVRAVTSDRVIHLAAEKQALAQTSGAAVVDMEGAAILTGLPNAAIAMLRVVSDDCHHDLPDLSQAFSAAGAIQPLPFAQALLRHPIAATRLIRGSLRGLATLQTLAKRLG